MGSMLSWQEAQAGSAVWAARRSRIVGASLEGSGSSRLTPGGGDRSWQSRASSTQAPRRTGEELVV